MRKKDWIVVLLLLGNAIGFVVLFLYDLSKYSDLTDRLIIGIVEYKNNIVQRKLDGNIVWETIQKNSLIANRDTIRSDSKSDAMIRLNDGTVIILDENTMFLLDITGSKPGIDITSGNISISKPKTSTEEFRIQTGSSIIDFQEGELSISKKDSDEVTVHLEKGKAGIAVQGKYLEIESGNLVEVSSNQEIQLKKIPFQILSPSNNQIFITKKDSMDISFRWKPTTTYSMHKLEISNTSDFQIPFKVMEYPKPEEVLNLPLGTYYWRLREKESSTPIYKFQIFKEVPANTNLPADHVILSYVEKPPNVYFQWDSDPVARDYDLEIAKDKDFQNTYQKIRTKSNSLSVDTIQQGEYFWRVRSNPISENLPARITPAKTFYIRKTNTYTPPYLVRPVEESITEGDFAKNGIFLWQGSNELDSYELQVAKNREMKDLLINLTLEKNFWKPEKNWKPGAYYWRVRGKTESGKWSDFSAVASFQIQPNESKQTETDKEASDSTIPKVATLEKEKDNLTEVKKNPIETAPTKEEVSKSVLIYPKDTVVDVSGKKSLKFEWSPWKDKNTEEYIFSIYNQTKGSKKPILQIKTKSLSYEFTKLELLEEGSFSWELAVTISGKVIHKESARFIISLEKLKTLKPEDIEFITPPIVIQKGKKE